MLYDYSGRKIDYLRLSVTDRCNLRCMYCMPRDGISSKTHSEILTFEEILRLVHIFVSLGVMKIRLTGGEPLVRKGIIDLVKALSGIDGIEELCLTTNGALLSHYAVDLKKAGLRRINISLDTLKEERFRNITSSNSLSAVLEGIKKAQTTSAFPLKLNTVIMKGVNDDEIIDFVNFALSKKITLRFIEFMKVTPLWREEHFMPIEEMIKICEGKFELKKLGKLDLGPAIYYSIGESGRIGFIRTEQSNCSHCNRVRLTSTGELKVCLYEELGLRLRDILRSGVSDWQLREIIREKMGTKQDIDYRHYEPSKFYMSDIGG